MRTAARKPEKTRMPGCLGTYERKHEVCDGGDGLPCPFRDRCVALRKLCELQVGRGVDPETAMGDYIRIKKFGGKGYAIARKEHDLFLKLDGVISDWGISSGVLTRKPKKRKRKKPKPKPKAENVGREATYRRVATFTSLLAKETGRTFVEQRAGAPIGSFYLIDRVETSGYATVYCKGAKGKIPVARVFVLVRSDVWRICLPAKIVQAEKLVSLEDAPKLRLSETNEGSFLTTTGKLNEFGVAIVCELIAELIQVGVMAMPELEG